MGYGRRGYRRIESNARVILGRNSGAWDAQTVNVGRDGRFTFDGVPTEDVQISTKVSGYHLSPKIPSLDAIYPEFLWGKVTEDLHDFLLLLEPGPTPSVDLDRVSRPFIEDNKRRRSDPLRGAPDEKSS